MRKPWGHTSKNRRRTIWRRLQMQLTLSIMHVAHHPSEPKDLKSLRETGRMSTWRGADEAAVPQQQQRPTSCDEHTLDWHLVLLADPWRPTKVARIIKQAPEVLNLVDLLFCAVGRQLGPCRIAARLSSGADARAGASQQSPQKSPEVSKIS